MWVVSQFETGESQSALRGRSFESRESAKRWYIAAFRDEGIGLELPRRHQIKPGGGAVPGIGASGPLRPNLETATGLRQRRGWLGGGWSGPGAGLRARSRIGADLFA